MPEEKDKMLIINAIFDHQQPTNGWQIIILHKNLVGKIIYFEGLTLSSHASVASLSLSKTDTGIVITGFSPRIRSPVLEFSIQIDNHLVEKEHLDTVSSWPPFRSPCQRSPGSSDGLKVVIIANMPLNQIELHSRSVDEDDIDRRR